MAFRKFRTEVHAVDCGAHSSVTSRSGSDLARAYIGTTDRSTGSFINYAKVEVSADGEGDPVLHLSIHGPGGATIEEFKRKLAIAPKPRAKAAPSSLWTIEEH